MIACVYWGAVHGRIEGRSGYSPAELLCQDRTHAHHEMTRKTARAATLSVGNIHGNVALEVDVPYGDSGPMRAFSNEKEHPNRNPIRSPFHQSVTSVGSSWGISFSRSGTCEDLCVCRHQERSRLVRGLPVRSHRELDRVLGSFARRARSQKPNPWAGSPGLPGHGPDLSRPSGSSLPVPDGRSRLLRHHFPYLGEISHFTPTFHCGFERAIAQGKGRSPEKQSTRLS